jgi:hypothetical protein
VERIDKTTGAVLSTIALQPAMFTGVNTLTLAAGGAQCFGTLRVSLIVSMNATGNVGENGSVSDCQHLPLPILTGCCLSARHSLIDHRQNGQFTHEYFHFRDIGNTECAAVQVQHQSK